MPYHNFSHTSVLLFECIEALNIRDGYTYIDCTTGGGGHSLEIAKKMGPNSHLICFDQDKDAINAAKIRLSEYLDRITFVNDNFSSLNKTLSEMNIKNLGGVLADLGCSSHQFDVAERGFSYMNDAKLDMRMNTDASLTAFKIVNEYSEERLRQIIYDYGEERFAPRIASNICKKRAESAIKTTLELVDIIKSSIPPQSRADGPHPAKRTFQAIRIEVNSELDVIAPLIRDSVSNLVTGGRIAIISFHSLEDRLVKQTYKDLAKGCRCPNDFPICVCGINPSIKEVNHKPILPTQIELENNPRSRSAKLRVAEKI